jgi:hypothetical protein
MSPPEGKSGAKDFVDPTLSAHEQQDLHSRAQKGPQTLTR